MEQHPIHPFQQVVPVVMIIAGLWITGSIVRSIYTIWNRRSIVFEEERQLAHLEKEQNELKTQLSQALTPQFVEKEARNKLGFVKEGETVIFLPQATGSGDVVKRSEDISLPPLRQWWRLFL